jgi:hypothetical protein
LEESVGDEKLHRFPLDLCDEESDFSFSTGRWARSESDIPHQEGDFHPWERDIP